MSECNVSTKITFLLAGMGVGALIALLLAPKSGEETRDYLASKALEGKDYVTAKGKEFRKQAEDLVEKSKDVVTKQKEMLSAALEAGRQAYEDEKQKGR